MKTIAKVSLAALLLAAMPAWAQPFNVRGDFNAWGEAPMNDDLDGSYSVTVGGLTAGARHNYKVAFNDWEASWPGSDGRTAVDGSGDITFHYFPGAIADGWNPAGDRVGYDDHGQFGWEIIGGFNDIGGGWDEPTNSAARQMSDAANPGGGLYSVDFTIATAGTYAWKFRESNSWDIAIGDDFGNSAADNSITTLTDNEIWTFELDLPNGRWRITPEPATLGLLGVGALIALRQRRSRRA